MLKPKPAATAPENLKKINEFFARIEPLILNLYSRWHDEKEYENINDYEDVIHKTMPLGFSIIKMSKRPFGFTFDIGTGAVYQIKTNGKTIEWKRIS